MRLDYFIVYMHRNTINGKVYIGITRQNALKRWSYGSGYPFTPTQGMYESINFDNGIGTDYVIDNGSYGIAYGEYNSARLPNYHRLDLSAKRRFSIGKRSILDLNFSVTNVYNRNNIFYFDRITFSRIDQLPILWSVGLTFNF